MTDQRDEFATGENDRAETAVEALRRRRRLQLNSRAASREELEARYGQVWAPNDLSSEFEVVGFAAPYVVVRRKQNGTMGSLEFQHHPRFYFNFEPDQPA